jgi:hypothetical protein
MLGKSLIGQEENIKMDLKKAGCNNEKFRVYLAQGKTRDELIWTRQ